MPKRIKQRWPDVNALAAQEPTPSELSRVMAALGRKGGKVGGKRRMETMTAEQRKDVASKAAKARWSKER